MMVVIKVSIEVLKIEISMPNAHFRNIHSNKPLKTYLVPPYSTVIGLLANILGKKESIETMLKGDLVLGMLSRHEFLTREYTWLRNLHQLNHRNRYGSVSNRNWQEVCEHIGGQSPVSVEVLNEVSLALYIYHSNPVLLETIQNNVTAPEKWLSHLHLGRAEDWVMIDSVSMFALKTSDNPADLRNSNQYYQWMPEPALAFGLNIHIDEKQYKELYQKIRGPATLVTSIYELVGVPYQGGKDGIIRNFKHLPARLFCSPLPFLHDFTLPTVFTDPKLNTPIYMANVTSHNGSGKED